MRHKIQRPVQRVLNQTLVDLEKELEPRESLWLSRSGAGGSSGGSFGRWEDLLPNQHKAMISVSILIDRLWSTFILLKHFIEKVWSLILFG